MAMKTEDRILFREPLVEGVIEQRRGQFTMLVTVDGRTVRCHCPTTGRIGNIDIGGRPCLLSKSRDPNRKTPYTVEAVSLNRPEEQDKTWIGINQNAANRYVEHYLAEGMFPDMISGTDVHRERFLGNSKLDFLVGDTYIEVKTPLQHLQMDIPAHVGTKRSARFSSTDRFTRHISELAGGLQGHQRAIILICFMYDNPGFRVIERSTNYEEVSKVVSDSISKGVEVWQVNFRITPECVEMDRYFKLDM